MEVDTKPVEEKKEEKKEEEKKEEEKKPDPEPSFETKSNPARVTANQVKYLSFNDERYTPVKEGEVFGIVMLKDNKPQEPENFITPAATGTNKTDEGPEPEAPEPFDYDPTKK